MTLGSWEDPAVTDPTRRASVTALLKGLLATLQDGGLVMGGGSEIIGAALDGGPAQSLTRTYTTSADMTTAAAITAAPTSGQKIVVMDIILSADTGMSFSLQEETSATVFAEIYLSANSPVQITPRGFLKTAVADKKLMGKASVAGNVAVTAIYFSEA